MRVLVSPHPHQHLFLTVFFTVAILLGMNWCLIVILICVSLMINDIGDLFMYLAILISLMKCFFKYVAHFKLDYLSSCYWVVRVLYVFRIQIIYQTYDFQIFSQSVACVLRFLSGNFRHRMRLMAHKKLILMKSYLSVVSFMGHASNVISHFMVQDWNLPPEDQK